MKTSLIILLLISFVVLNGCTFENKPSETETTANETTLIDKEAAAKSKFVITWPRMRADAFGCMLEKEFGFKDGYYNCLLRNYSNSGDPCNDAGNYYHGPGSPEKYLSELHPNLAAIDLAFEHGELQEVSLIFKSPLSKPAAQSAFSLPAEGEPLPENIMAINYGTSGNESPENITGISLVGFEHLGTADLDCAGLEDDEED